MLLPELPKTQGDHNSDILMDEKVFGDESSNAASALMQPQQPASDVVDANNDQSLDLDKPEDPFGETLQCDSLRSLFNNNDSKLLSPLAQPKTPTNVQISTPPPKDPSPVNVKELVTPLKSIVSGSLDVEALKTFTPSSKLPVSILESIKQQKDDYSLPQVPSSKMMASRVMHLQRRCARLHHKLKKLQLCQLRSTVESQLSNETNIETEAVVSSLSVASKKFESVSKAVDSDVTDSSSEEDNSDLDIPNVTKPLSLLAKAPLQKILTETQHRDNKQFSDNYHESSAGVYNKWQWLQFQISDLEHKILKTSDSLRKVRAAEPRCEFGSVPFALSADGSTEETLSAARARGLKKFNKKTMSSTLSIVTQSNKSAFVLPTYPCTCSSLTCCIMCGGPGAQYLDDVDPSKSDYRSRVQAVHPGYHKVLSSTVPLNTHLARLVKQKKWSHSTSRSKITVKSKESRESSTGKEIISSKKTIITGGGDDDKVSEVSKPKDMAKKLKDVVSKNGKRLKHRKDLDSKSGHAKKHRREQPSNSIPSKETVPEKKTLHESYKPDLSESSSDEDVQKPIATSGKVLKDLDNISTKESPVSRKPAADVARSPSVHSDIQKPVKQPLASATASSKSSSTETHNTRSSTASDQSAPQSPAVVTAPPSNHKQRSFVESDPSEEIVIPLSNTLPVFEPVQYKNIETPQWRINPIHPLSSKHYLDDMSSLRFMKHHEVLEKLERSKHSGLIADPNSLHAVENSSEDEELPLQSLTPYEKREFPLSQGRNSNENRVVASQRTSHDFFDVV